MANGITVLSQQDGPGFDDQVGQCGSSLIGVCMHLTDYSYCQSTNYLSTCQTVCPIHLTIYLSSYLVYLYYNVIYSACKC